MKKLLALSCAIGMLASVAIASAAEVSTTEATTTEVQAAQTTQTKKKVYKVSYPTYKASVATARTEVPKEAVLFGYKSEKNIDLLQFRDNDSYIEYKVKIDNVLNKILEMEIHGSNIAGSTTIKYTSTGIMDIIKKAYPDAKNISIEKKQDGNNFYYEAEFDIAKGEVEAKINPFTGAFAHTEIEFK